ncbi:MAG: hypothetical protein LC745_12245, partial [Planctomycetia bacterium]|nr:hypothetical protein [Planctomycetia bacterium]
GLQTLPSDIVAMGGKFLWDDDKETPEVLSSNYLFPEQKQMIEFEVRPWATNTESGVGVGNLFYGSDGYLAVKGYNSFEAFDKSGKLLKKNSDGDPVGKHFANFIDAVRRPAPQIRINPAVRNSLRPKSAVPRPGADWPSVCFGDRRRRSRRDAARGG